VSRLTPIVELTYTSPATTKNADSPTTVMVAPGVLYSGDTWQFGVEALIPANRATGRNVGVIAQFHLFLDDLFPTGIGRPIFE
jgi:hypothetical protein